MPRTATYDHTADGEYIEVFADDITDETIETIDNGTAFIVKRDAWNDTVNPPIRVIYELDLVPDPSAPTRTHP